MWTTQEEVKELTGKDVDLELITQAQAIIESYVGRLEIEVGSATDAMLLGRATAYQAAYMLDDSDRVFSQVSAMQIMQFGNMVSFRDSLSPFVAPLAIIACQRLSWKRIRSVKTGSIYARPVVADDWRTA